MSLQTSRASRIFQQIVLPILVALCFSEIVFVFLWGFHSWESMGLNVEAATWPAQKLMCCFGLALVLGGPVYALVRELVRDRDEVTKERPVWFYPVLSGVLSLVAMCVAYSFIGMWPFGEKSGMMVDMHHQYAPLLAGLRDNLLSGELSLYSFEVGLGANYLSLGAYYLASPFNLLLLLFPENLLAEGILFITLLKNALSGAMFALCVQQIFRKREMCIPAVSVMYSLMMYLLAYSWNLMWLDVVMVLPLVIWGFERLMHTGKYLTYLLSLTYALFANYYIAFMLCIFIVLYYLTYCLRSRRTGKELAISFARVAGFSALAVGLVAVLLIPVYLALKLTSASGAELPEMTNTLDMFQLLGRHFANAGPTIRSGNLPNIFCGVLAVFCVPLFALNKGIPLRRRLAFMILWLVMAFSFLINLTDLGWHGLHAPNDLPYRFSFLYSFVLLLMAYETLLHYKEIDKKHVFAVFAGIVLYLLVEERFGGDKYDFKMIYANLALVAIYTVILAVSTHRRLRRGVFYSLILLVVTAEMVFCGGRTVVQLNANEYFTRHEDYVDNDTTAAIYEAVERAQELGDSKYGGDFYRLEVLPRRTCVDTALFHYRGITNFASSNYYATTKQMGGWGYAINGVNSHLYHTFMPFTDSLLGIRYLVSTANLVNHPQLAKVDSVTVGDSTYYIYENGYALGLGYVVDPYIKDYQYTQYDPISSLEDLYGTVTSTYKRLLKLQSFTADQSSGASVGYSFPGFRVQPTGSLPANFTATVEDAGQVYVFVDCMAADAISVTCGGNTFSVSPYEPYIFDVGVLSEGTTVTLSITSDIACNGNFYVATLDDEAYTKGMKELKQSQLKVSRQEGNRVSGTVDAKKAGVMMTSIPYDTGWTVRVDGKAVDTYAVCEGFLAFDMAEGKHTVEMEFYPDGWWFGVLISGASLVILLVVLMVTWLLWRRKQKPAPAEYLDYDSALPIQEGFSTDAQPMTACPPLPETFAELTGENPISAEDVLLEEPTAPSERPAEEPAPPMPELYVPIEVPDEDPTPEEN
ncbi:MAG: YfhO family protein [Clostridia bacterium]|nr:YfhO family protein [Clostridia bacterium]